MYLAHSLVDMGCMRDETALAAVWRVLVAAVVLSPAGVAFVVLGATWRVWRPFGEMAGAGVSSRAAKIRSNAANTRKR
jgi:hypothetical protein